MGLRIVLSFFLVPVSVSVAVEFVVHEGEGGCSRSSAFLSFFLCGRGLDQSGVREHPCLVYLKAGIFIMGKRGRAAARSWL